MKVVLDSKVLKPVRWVVKILHPKEPMIQRVKQLPRIAIAVCILFGCGGGSTGTGAFSGGIDQKKTIGTFTDAEVQQFCNRFKDFARDSLTPEKICTLSGIFQASFSSQFEPENSTPQQQQQMCEVERASCLNDSEASSAGEPECDISSSIDVQQCRATAGELETCFNERIDALKILFDGISCDLLVNEGKAEQLAVEVQEAQRTNACESIERQCPGIFD